MGTLPRWARPSSIVYIPFHLGALLGMTRTLSLRVGCALPRLLLLFNLGGTRTRVLHEI